MADMSTKILKCRGFHYGFSWNVSRHLYSSQDGKEVPGTSFMLRYRTQNLPSSPFWFTCHIEYVWGYWVPEGMIIISWHRCWVVMQAFKRSLLRHHLGCIICFFFFFFLTSKGSKMLNCKLLLWHISPSDHLENTAFSPFFIAHHYDWMLHLSKRDEKYPSFNVIVFLVALPVSSVF